MQPRIENLLRLAMTLETAEDVIRQACCSYGNIAGIRVMFTRQEFLPRQITAIVEMEQRVALDIAFAHGVENLGTRLVVFRYDAPEGFQFCDRIPPARPSENQLPKAAVSAAIM